MFTLLLRSLAGQPLVNQSTNRSTIGAGRLRHGDTQSAAQKLLSTIQSFPGDLASTPDGRNWVIKALHPSDPTALSRGVPDPSSCPNVVLAYYNVFRISCPSGNTDPWGFDLTVLPNALVPGYFRTLASDGLTITAEGNFLNSGFSPPTDLVPVYSHLLTQFRSLGIEAHRLVAMGVTAYQDGPALANQGTLTAAQYQVARRKYYACPDFGIAAPRFAVYQNNDEANYDTSQHMPNAYFGESKDGCYLPLRLSQDAIKWRTEADLEYPNGSGTNSSQRNLTIPNTTGPAWFPYPACERGYYAGGLTLGDLVFAPLNGIWGGISARNLSYQTSFAFYVRMTIECRVSPTSTLAPQQSMSPPYDPVAMASYFRISRELKDAYPADYNDWGKLWDVIKGAAKVALPALSMVPGPVGLIASAAHAGVNAVDSLVARKSAPRDSPPAASVQRVADRVAAERVARPIRVPKRKAKLRKK